VAPRQLKGERYLRAVDPIHATGADPALAQFIVDELHYLDFDETCRFYASILPTMTDADAALLGCNDRFFLLTAIMGRKDVVHPWLFDRCREVEAEPDDFLDLWAREHYKSTVITYAGTVQEIMADPELTVVIFSVTAGVARKFVQQIKSELERNELLKRLYKDVLWENPKKDAPSWSLAGGLVVRRTTNPKEKTLEGYGLIDGMPTGGHWELRIYDDLITERHVTNPEMVKKSTEMWELSDNLGAKGNRKWHIGTRYSFADTYGTILERKILKPRIYAATDNGQMDGKPVFRDLAWWETKKKVQRSSLAAQMLQNPLAGSENTFRPEWLRPWETRPSTLVVYIMCDPSKGRTSSSDRTAIAVVGIDSGGNKYLLDGMRHRMSLSERWAAIKMFWHKWTKERGVQHVSVGYERYGQQTDDEYFQERMMIENISIPMEELAWPREGGASKKDRVGRLEPDFRLGRFYLPAIVYEPGMGDCYWQADTTKGHIVTRPVRDLTSAMQTMKRTGQDHRNAKAIRRLDEDGKIYDVTRALMEEMLFFPFSPKDDLVDALSRVFDMQPVTPAVYEDLAAQSSAEEHFIDA
jgi:hypothetical protein